MSFDHTLTRLSSSESVASPLRKKSILALANTKDSTKEVLNDDDAEIRERRRKSFAPDQPTNSAAVDTSSRRKSLGLGACSGLSTAQLAEHYASCIKLSTENKITVKNAFSLQLIDYMSMMLKRHDKQMEDFQVASCTLDASTKIYSFRVDAVHSDVVQMATTMGRAEASRKKKNTEEDDGGPDGAADNDNRDDGPESQVLKKLKKKSRKLKSSLADNPESLQRKQQNFQTMDPFLVRLSATLAVSQSGECPFHHSSKVRDNFVEFDIDKESQQSCKVPLPSIPDIKNLELCPSFRDFKMVGWRPENDPTPVPDIPPPPSIPPISNLDDGDAFDLNQTPEPIPDFDCGGGGVFDGGVDSDPEEIYACPEAANRAASKLARQPAHVVDLKQHLSTVPLEYSYFQQSMLSMWAGPTHWKVMPLRKDKEKDVAVHKEAKKRAKKEIVISFEDSSEIREKYFGSATKKLKPKTIQNWSVDRVTNVRNIYYDPTRITRLFCRENISIKVEGDTPTPEVDEGVGEYQYDNVTDRTSFCPNVPQEDDNDDHGADAGDGMMHDDGDGMMHDDDDVFQTQDVDGHDHEAGAFTGDNLIAAPNKVAKMYIPYQMRAKKMDMKKLKGAMWSILTKCPQDDLESISQKTDDRKLEGSLNFSTLYESLPQRLPSKMAENLSCPLAFVGLLHLANEQCLDIKGVPDMSDLVIRQG
ncbi:Condensin complex subunit 2 [Frankliniella fusca]|uniref:Condensin complex subunit 2 n=1 Tax=Frankliniella fusca TaxID=407009 RepID=A0AAE1HIW4_9NEOP|nr:Condensin complex subunit 2 [Frankliniella fusca]